MRRRKTNQLEELRRELSSIRIANARCDLRNGQRLIAEQLPGSLHSSLHEVLMRRNPHRVAERFGKMELAHARRHREVLERQRLVDVPVNVLDRAAELRPMSSAAA